VDGSECWACLLVWVLPTPAIDGCPDRCTTDHVPIRGLLAILHLRRLAEPD
jgi:hypothetical protein